MGLLAVLMCQVLDLGTPAPPEELPRAMELEWESRPPHSAEQMIGLEFFAVWTRWDSGLRIDDGWGLGGDVKIGLDWGTPVTLNIKLGYAGWNTDNDDQQTFPAKSKIRQYRLGVGGDFATHWIDFGLYAIVGLYHFHSVITNDTDTYFSLEATISFKPVPHLKVGLLGAVTWVSSDFNRASTHLFMNHSIGPVVEFTF